MILSPAQMQYLSQLISAISLWCQPAAVYDSASRCKVKMLECVQSVTSIPSAIQACFAKITP